MQRRFFSIIRAGFLLRVGNGKWNRNRKPERPVCLQVGFFARQERPVLQEGMGVRHFFGAIFIPGSFKVPCQMFCFGTSYSGSLVNVAFKVYSPLSLDLMFHS